MKKILFLLLLPFWVTAQVSNGTETEFEALKTTNSQTVTNGTHSATMGTDGTIGKSLLKDLPVDLSPLPLNYTIADQKLGSHLTGIDNKLGTIVATTAGISTRVWFTADPTTITAGTFYLTNATGKGTIASAIQSVINDDNQKKYYPQDLIGNAFATATLFPVGVYAGNLSASTTPNSAQQRWTVELYKCDTNGTPIASGITGAPVGSLGVTVITILDSGLLTLADGSVTNIQVSGNLVSPLSVAVGERIRYHVSAEKVGTTASNITQSVYYGTSYNSYLDVPIPLNTTAVSNLSGVVGATTTDALNSLNASIPINYSKIVYVNDVNPNSATIFDLENPPVTNDNALKTDVNNLYVGTDASGWVYNSTSLTYVTKSVTSITSNFYLSGTTSDAGTTKTAPIYRNGGLSIGADTPIGKFNVFTGTSTDTANISGQMSGSISFSNSGSVSAVPSIIGKSNDSSGLKLGSGTNDGNISSDILFDIRENDNTEFATLTSVGFRFRRFNSVLVDIYRNGVLSVKNLSGSDDRAVVASSNGDLKTVPYIITITTSTSITTATADSNSVGQNGKHVIINNGVNAINLTCNGGVTTSYGKVGTGAITFVQGSGRTLVQLTGTSILNGIAGSEAKLWSNGTTDYLTIINY